MVWFVRMWIAERIESHFFPLSKAFFHYKEWARWFNPIKRISVSVKTDIFFKQAVLNT